MGFIITVPGAPELESQRSTQSIIHHAWQTIGSQCLLRGTSFVEFADQAKTYFMDAQRSDWRSAGLLYYYSFLNLAKVILVNAQRLSREDLTRSSAQHGLSTEPQEIDSIADFKFTIHPQRAGTQNIFALFYGATAGVPWPFQHTVTLALSDVLPYCTEITIELVEHLGVVPRAFPAQLLFRQLGPQQGTCWLDMVVPTTRSQAVIDALANTPVPLTLLPYASLTAVDRSDWLAAFDHTAQDLQGAAILRSTVASDPDVVYQQAMALEPFCTVSISSSDRTPWWFTLPITLLDRRWHPPMTAPQPTATMRWHPMLSDYLFAYCLSTILRYYPYLLRPATIDHFIAQAWCNESPSSTLRYFLLKLTNPGIRIGQSM